jgi:zinc carboxypeptidase
MVFGAVETPEEHFGFQMGADRKLVSWDGVVSYLDKLDAASDKLSVANLGNSTEGNPFLAATISAPATLRDLNRYRRIQEKLADPRTISDTEANGLIADGKAIVMITCSIHSTEVGSTHTAMEFAHRMVTATDATTRKILDNVIFILVPSLNPDGVEIVRKWYEKQLGTSFEGTSPPELYQKYVGHDNNRDWYIFSQAETRLAISKLHNVWHPQIVYDVHQTGTAGERMFLPPWLDPSDPNIDPVLVQLCNTIGMGMAADLTLAGKQGVVVNSTYDFWTPARHYQAYHHGMRILSESASARLATPIQVKPDQMRPRRGFDPRVRSWNHVEPWPAGEWKLRDIVDYQLIAWQSCLRQAAERREDLLRAFYQMGKRAVARTEPYAFLIPPSQDDPGSARRMLDTLQFGMVEIEEAGARFEADGQSYPAGSYIVRMQQPYSSWAKTLLEEQDYPDMRLYPDGPPRRPYDVTAHTFPLLMGVDVITVDDRFQAELKGAGKFTFDLKGRRPAADGFAASDIDSWKQVNRVWKDGGEVWRDRLTGDFYADKPDSPETFALTQPKVGLYRSWVPSMDEGWTRWALEQFGFDYERVTNEVILTGNLKSKFDVIVFPDQRASSLVDGYKSGSMPAEFTGGLNNRAVASLKAYLAEGGRLVFLNNSTAFAIDRLGIRARNALTGVGAADFYSPGSLLNITLANHPLTYGLPPEIAIWSQGSPAFETNRPRTAKAIGRYPTSGVLASGWLLGERHITGKAAILEVPSGRGSVILFGMRPQYRGQSYQSFKLFFNSLVQ